MIVINKNEGPKIPYEVMGKKICFDDDLTINLAKRQGEEAEHIDVCYDRFGNLVLGAAAGRAYVAEIDIPAKEYEYHEPEGEGDGAEPPTPIPLDMDKVTLTLWAVE